MSAPVNNSLFSPDKIIYCVIGLFVILILGYIFAPQTKFSCDRGRNVCILSKATPIIPITISQKYYKIDTISFAATYYKKEILIDIPVIIIEETEVVQV